jgi:hypothetical protein
MSCIVMRGLDPRIHPKMTQWERCIAESSPAMTNVAA